ncbi:universal stress protein [Gottfriedia acidiceleris]|uniref:universal stress protein n=1 Tax=Gottfriedia acidiceleris TaxID=371036 RepID=UPI00249EA21D|nr:universal stress protein [Gottfriedia acidiceleris]
MSDKQFRRKTPEELLESIQKIKKGRLKIIIGTVSGSGKTYHMLQEGNGLKERGIDVVIGLISETNRQKTIDQVGCLEKIPTIKWEEGGTVKQDLDLAAIISRNPEVVLVDSLAHQNRLEAIFPTRLEDINYLLSKNISVITTMNIYEIKEVYDEAEKLTGGKVRSNLFVPEETLALADEVRLLDVTPEVILQRSNEDYDNKGENKKRHQLFHKSNLAVLRELALRFIASEVNDELDEYREKHGIVGPSGASEKILVTVQYHLNGSILVRRGQQISKRLGGDLHVVCFQPPNKKFTNDELTFKRSIIKLVEKVGGNFEELSLTSHSIASEIIKYAINSNITSIVIGQSKRTRLEEIVKGSIVNKILRKTSNIDVFIVADRAEKDGERVIPTKQVNKEVVNPYRRLSPQELAHEIHKIKRGSLKVYIGAAPGVGKTYTMLREGNELKKKGIDIVIGLLETHGRKETLEKVGDLEIIPRSIIPYKETTLEEMDTEAIIQRNPEVVLIDELAHTNAPGSKFNKRYKDVEEILEAGISVISTMNIQHVESLNDSVEQITGVRVRETVPDQILREANEIELIDISPKALRQRIREGRIYAPIKIEQSLNNFFKTGNLIALRELALREVADDVDERLEAWERDLTLRGPWRQEEVIFVCVNLKSNSERLIRRGFRIAYRLKAKLFVAFVKDHDKLSEKEKLSLKIIKDLTERLGGSFELYETTDRRHVFIELVKNICEKKTTHVIIGQSARTRWQEIKTGSIVQKLLRELRFLDVLVVADQSAKSCNLQRK